MSRRFMRYVRSVSYIRESGTDLDFYRGPDFVRLPKEVADPVRQWCGETLHSVALGKEGPEDDPIEVFVLPLGNNNEFAELKKILCIILMKITRSIVTPQPEDFFASESNAYFDTYRNSAEIRDFVLRIEGEIDACKKADTIKDPAILIDA